MANSAEFDKWMSILASGWWLERKEACHKLGALGDARALAPLLARLADEADVREAACDALGALGQAELAAAGETLVAGRSVAITTLTPEAADHLLRGMLLALDAQVPAWRQRACIALGALGDTRAAKPLLPRLADGDGAVRSAACTALGALGDARAVEPLLTRLADRSSAVRRAACTALGTLGDARAVEPLLARLADDYPVRAAARRALGSLCAALAASPYPGADAYCPRCLRRPATFAPALPREARQALHLKWWQRIRYIACPGCLGNTWDRAETIVAVLDEGMAGDSHEDGIYSGDWLARKAHFDFDRVEIRRASELEVERFCILVGNDTDPRRRKRYKKMPVRVTCALPENALRILRHFFGTIAVDRAYTDAV